MSSCGSRSLSDLRLSVAAPRFGGTARFARRPQFDLRIISGRNGRCGSRDCARLRKEKDRLEKDIESKQARLSDETFRSKAPAKIVQQMEATLEERRVELAKATERLAQLEKLSAKTSMPAPRLPGTTDRRIDALLTLLSENPMIVISGQKIAREIGVSRSAVWHWTQRLRALGVRVKGHPRTGYHIERVPDVLVADPAASPAARFPLRQAHPSFLQGRLDQRRSPSTWDARASRRAPSCWPRNRPPGAAAPGRSWHSEKTAGIYVTVLLRPAVSPLVAPVHHPAGRAGRARCRAGRNRIWRRTCAGRTIC